jgi:hypothetical protein
LTPEIQATLTSLLIAVLGALGLYVRYATEQFKRKLDEQKAELVKNTEITQQVESQTNGQLAKARDEAQKFRLISERQARVLAEQRWLISQLQKREDGRALIDAVMQARRAVVHDGDYESLEEQLLHREPK